MHLVLENVSKRRRGSILHCKNKATIAGEAIYEGIACLAAIKQGYLRSTIYHALNFQAAADTFHPFAHNGEAKAALFRGTLLKATAFVLNPNAYLLPFAADIDEGLIHTRVFTNIHQRFLNGADEGYGNLGRKGKIGLIDVELKRDDKSVEPLIFFYIAA